VHRKVGEVGLHQRAASVLLLESSTREEVRTMGSLRGTEGAVRILQGTHLGVLQAKVHDRMQGAKDVQDQVIDQDYMDHLKRACLASMIVP
jgi:hypothetical protein